MIYFRGDAFERVIPMGEECYACCSLDLKFNSHGLRKEAFPSDYVGHVFIEKISDKLASLALLREEDISVQDTGSERFFTDTAHGFRYWHDPIDRDKDESEEKTRFLEKYNRRYQRLAEALATGSIIVFSVRHFDDVYYDKPDKTEDVKKLYTVLKKKNPGIVLVAVNYGPESFEEGDLYHFRLAHDRDAVFQASKADFTDKLFGFVRDNFLLDP